MFFFFVSGKILWIYFTQLRNKFNFFVFNIYLNRRNKYRIKLEKLLLIETLLIFIPEIFMHPSELFPDFENNPRDSKFAKNLTQATPFSFRFFSPLSASFSFFIFIPIHTHFLFIKFPCYLLFSLLGNFFQIYYPLSSIACTTTMYFSSIILKFELLFM